MTYITYSQPKLKKDWDDRIRQIFNIVKTKATPDLWIKVLIYRNKEFEFLGEARHYEASGYRGHYRYALQHGFYDEEWKFIGKHPKIKHCITLKIGESCSDEDIAELIAHEFRHYLQWKKYRNPKQNLQVERDAKKWAKKRVNQLIAEHKIKHRAVCDGFTFWKFQEGFKQMFE
jgi:hypothetical protein